MIGKGIGTLGVLGLILLGGGCGQDPRRATPGATVAVAGAASAGPGDAAPEGDDGCTGRGLVVAPLGASTAPDASPDATAEPEDDGVDGDEGQVASTQAAAAARRRARTFSADVRPILEARCHVCHYPGRARGMTPLVSYEDVRLGRTPDGRPLVVPRKAKQSVIVKNTGRGGIMSDRLTAAEAATIKAWVTGGALEGTVATLVVSAIEPRTGTTSGGTAVRIDGIDLSTVTKVTVGGVALTSLRVNGSRSLTGLTGARAAGLVDVVVESSARGSATLRASFTYVSPVAYSGAPLVGSTNPFDQSALAVLKARAIEPAKLSGDAEFLRRVTVDLTGRTPRDAELVAFLADASPDKRDVKIDELLASKEFGDFWAGHLIAPWFLAGMNTTARRAFDSSVSKAILEGRTLPQIVGDMAAGTAAIGSNYDGTINGKGIYEKMSSLVNATTGYTPGCARCHDHKLTTAADEPRWRQSETYGLFAFFATKPTDAIPRDTSGRAVGAPVEPAFAIDRSVTGLPTLADPLAVRRARFAELLVASTAFGRGLGHRIWAEVMGPLLDPDDFRAETLAGVAAPELLATVARVFDEERGSLTGYLRVILRSRLYQLARAGTPSPEAATGFFARRSLRRLHAEPLLGALPRVALATDPGLTAVLLQRFGFPALRATIKERSDEPNPAQALILMNSNRAVPGLLNQSSSLLRNFARQIDAIADPAARNAELSKMIQRLFRIAITRDPTPDELAFFMDEASRAASTREALEDTAVALSTTTEFVVR